MTIYYYIMSDSQIHIYEENINLFWGLLGILTIASGTYLLADAFFAGNWKLASIQQIGSIALFAIGFYAIIKLTDPLYHFILSMQDEILCVEIWQGSESHLNTKKIRVNEITDLKAARHTPRKENEALFDFSTNYHLLYRTGKEQVYESLIDLEKQSFALKLKDIEKVIKFLKQQNRTIKTSRNLLPWAG